jgi:hypothetical protein
MGRLSTFLVGMCSHQRGVDINDDLPTIAGSRCPRQRPST